jgi:thiamine pyrophosphate-dependent acetolactate synthase large subunit-like protein
MTPVAGFVLQRLRQWGAERVHGCPGDGVDGVLGAFGRAEGRPEFMRTRHEETAAFMACAHTRSTGEAWDEALAPRLPVVLGFQVDREIAPIPPDIMEERGKKAAEAAVRDPGVGITAKGVRQKFTEPVEHLPGRH